MNALVLYFASGDSLYFGVALLLLAIAASPYFKHHMVLRCRNIAAWVALAMIVMACPPFPWIIGVVFLGVFVWWFIGSNWTATGRVWAKLRLITTSVLMVLLLAASAIEFFHRRMPEIVGTPSDHLVVIGDSISSGIGLHVPAWPLVMQQMTGVPVKNLARAGADTIEAQSMAKEIGPEDRVLLVEIGGNDMIAGVPPGEFGEALDALLSKVSAPGRTVVMFELPLLPNKMAYGYIQRRLSAKYGVWLIPKRFFVSVIGGANATSDGLHLSDTGTRHMAVLMAHVLSPVLKLPADN
jgi:hypothetical protein